jgi:hypothetical protein
MQSYFDSFTVGALQWDERRLERLLHSFLLLISQTFSRITDNERVEVEVENCETKRVCWSRLNGEK